MMTLTGVKDEKLNKEILDYVKTSPRYDTTEYCKIVLFLDKFYHVDTIIREYLTGDMYRLQGYMSAQDLPPMFPTMFHQNAEAELVGHDGKLIVEVWSYII